jgi:Zn-dependent protease
MSDKFTWTTSVGRWFGIPVRIHLFLILFFVVVFGVEWQISHANPTRTIVGSGFVTSIVLLLSLLVHELAHVFAINNLGGHIRSLVLMPWGGNSDIVYPESNGSRMITHLAGPFINGFVFVIGAMLLLQTTNQDLESIINPFGPHAFDAGDWERSLIAIVTWVNFQIFIVNLIPCFPFDGIEILRSVFESVNAELSRIKIESTLMAIGHLVGVAMIGVAWLMPTSAYASPIPAPPWIVLVVAGITLIFCSKFACHTEINELSSEDWDMDDLEGYDPFYDENSSVDFTDDDQYSQWLNEKRAERETMERELEEAEETQADEILQKLHRDGMTSLSEEEKSLLARVSERIRRRRQVQ